jgi:hypothetical protein
VKYFAAQSCKSAVLRGSHGGTVVAPASGRTRLDLEGSMHTINSPEQLMRLAEQGALSKFELAELLEPDSRHVFLEACRQIERGITDDCIARGEFCLQSGCPLDEGEVCLDAILETEPRYHQACATAWLPIYKDPRNRAVD